MPNTKTTDPSIPVYDFNGVDKIIMWDIRVPLPLDLRGSRNALADIGYKIQQVSLGSLVPLDITLSPRQQLIFPDLPDLMRGGGLEIGISLKDSLVDAADCIVTWDGQAGTTFTAPDTWQPGDTWHIVGQYLDLDGDGVTMVNITVGPSTDVELTADRVMIGTTQMWPHRETFVWPNFPKAQAGVTYETSINLGTDLQLALLPDTVRSAFTFDPPPDQEVGGNGGFVLMWDAHPDGTVVVIRYIPPLPQGHGTFARIAWLGDAATHAIVWHT